MAKTIRMTTAQAIVKFLDNQYVSMDGVETKFVEGLFSDMVSLWVWVKLLIQIQDSFVSFREEMSRACAMWQRLLPSRVTGKGSFPALHLLGLERPIW